MDKVLITGATGFLGRHLTEAFRRRGYAVVASARSKDESLPAEAWALGDLEDPAVQRAAVAGCVVVVHAAGRVGQARPGASERDLLFRVNAALPVSLAQAAARAGVKRFLQVSSTGVYGRGAPDDCTEEAPCRPEGDYEQSKRAGEEGLRALPPTAMPLVIVRPSNVFGEGHPWNKLLTWMKSVKAGRAVLAGRPERAFANYVYAPDVAEAVVSLAECANLRGGEAININTPASLAEFFRATAAAVGSGATPHTIPAPALLLVATLCDWAGRLTGRSLPITREKVEELTRRQAFSSARLKHLCPDFPRIGLADGLARLANHYANAGLL